ncbi:hypothetical protein M1P56_19385 [Streptomyces sp. HU2014]|uniref:N-acetyltransferase domain-containing protein n=1 Tax=Streptomyces albireticuli TaxID=1940 RepID=A0A1Z2KVL1_9ACTN|nr:MULTISPECIES: hypothetical protein [Streptomyces]ARZ66098.1 hypothetical protein SMD11_0432 [Streptomyces albireticuli]UQI46355.1 hypothetical protein M1P56_19385 [Streptomyces sp. HU2014]
MTSAFETFHDRDTAPAGHWPDDDRTLAVAVARDGDTVVGSVALLDLGAEDSALRIVALPDATDDTWVPLMREAARVAREAGGTVLRWVAETDGMPERAVAELGATEGGEIYRWWRLTLPAARTGPAGDAVRSLPAPDGAAFRLGLDGALFDVEVEGGTAVLAHDREEEGTAAGLTELLAAVLGKVSAEHPEAGEAEAYADSRDDALVEAMRALGFTPTDRRAAEYHLALRP